MKKVMISNGTKLGFLAGEFEVDGFNGSIVFGTLTDDAGEMSNLRLTLNEVGKALREVDGNEYNIVFVRFQVICKETGDEIEVFDTMEEAIEVIKEYEKEDIKNGEYTSDFYDVNYKLYY